MSEKEGRKYIGVDLGAWYSKKTKIAVLGLEEDDENKINLELLELISENSLPENSTSESWNKCNIYHKNELLVEYIKDKANGNALIGIDCPFAIPKYLTNRLSAQEYKEYQNKKLYFPKNMTEDKNEKKISKEKKEELNNKRELLNPVIFDNSARFVYEKTNQIVLGPAGDKIGKMTARMSKIVELYSCRDKLNIVRTPKLDGNSQISTIEVFPTATIFQIAKSQGRLNKYFKTENNKGTPFDTSKKLGVRSYKGSNWSGKKDNMLELIRPYIENIDKFDGKYGIKTDDDYDAVICALTAYWVDKNGYEEPDNKKDHKKFKNSFIYIPIIK